MDVTTLVSKGLCHTGVGLGGSLLLCGHAVWPCQFNPGDGEYVDQLWCSLDTLTGGANGLVVRINENGGLNTLLSE